MAINAGAIDQGTAGHTAVVVARRVAPAWPRSCRSPASSSCTPGCPTPWPARRRSPRSDPRRHHGRRRRVPGRPPLRQCSSRACQIGGSSINLLSAVIGAATTLVGAGLRAFVQDRHQEGAGVLDGQRSWATWRWHLGVGAWTAAVFHLTSRTLFFKACLFLGAGSVRSRRAQLRHEEGSMGGLTQVHADAPT